MPCVSVLEPSPGLAADVSVIGGRQAVGISLSLIKIDLLFKRKELVRWKRLSWRSRGRHVKCSMY